MKHRGTSRENRMNRSRGNSQTDRKRTKSPKQASITDRIQLMSSEQLINSKIEIVKSSYPKFKIQNENALPSIKISKQQDYSSPINRKYNPNHDNTIELLKQQIYMLTTQLNQQKEKNKESIQKLQSKIRKLLQINLLYSNKLQELGTKIMIMKSHIGSELNKYFEESCLIFTKVVEEVYYQLSSHQIIDHNQKKNKKDKNNKPDYGDISPIKEVDQQNSNLIFDTVEPQQKLIKIIDNIKKLRQFVNVKKQKNPSQKHHKRYKTEIIDKVDPAQTYHTDKTDQVNRINKKLFISTLQDQDNNKYDIIEKGKNQPVVLQFIQDLRNYDQKKSKIQKR